MCAEWRGREGFQRFLADMGERPEGMTLDRVEVDGSYEPGNCRWATTPDQGRNTTSTALNVVAVSLIRHMRRRGVLLKDLSHAFGVGITTVQSAATGETWS